ncbi:hypothetical protein V757_12240 [Pelistega indica]|uniref:Uncharacterized protein n=1 Tax=Pelistega indica TaxID=1414851 RepID=V8FTH0_9BURK|nr:hypothetical protein [Pelistega indica]ETD66722.1 hypothetical protein V757_12240 [Pelistega indica]
MSKFSDAFEKLIETTIKDLSATAMDGEINTTTIAPILDKLQAETGELSAMLADDKNDAKYLIDIMVINEFLTFFGAIAMATDLAGVACFNNRRREISHKIPTDDEILEECENTVFNAKTQLGSIFKTYSSLLEMRMDNNAAHSVFMEFFKLRYKQAAKAVAFMNTPKIVTPGGGNGNIH